MHLPCALKTDDTQAKLYLAISNVGSDKTGDAKFVLSKLPKERLHDRDVKLLEAATAMASKILAQPIPGMETPQRLRSKALPLPASAPGQGRGNSG